MHRGSLTLISLAALLVAIAAWCSVGFLYFDASSRLTASAQSLSSADAQNAQQAGAVQVEALASQTAAQRSSLQSLLAPDVVGIAGQIQSAGQAAGAQTTIGSASIVQASGLPSGVTEIEFVVQSEGSFAQVLRAAQLFETLPLASDVVQLDFEQAPAGTPAQGGQWQLTTELDVLTSAQISS